MRLKKPKAASVQYLVPFGHNATFNQFVPVKQVHVFLFKRTKRGFAFFLHPKRMVKIDQRPALLGNSAADLEHHNPGHAVGQAEFDCFIQQVFDFVGEFRLQF